MNEKDARYRAMESLQEIRKQSPANSSAAEEADYAIELALNSSRKVDQYLVRNLRRDARRILGRKNQREAVQFVPLNSAHPARPSSPAGWADLIPCPCPTPLEALLSKEAEADLLSRILDDSRSASLAAALLRGDSLKEAASSMGISLSYAKKIRRQMRERYLASLNN